MANQRYNIIHIDKDAISVAGSPSGIRRDISTAIDLNEEEGIEASADDFNFTIKPRNLPTIDGTPLLISPQDGIEIYMGSGAAAPSGNTNNLVMVGLVDTLVYNLSTNGRNLQVKGVNSLEAILNSLQPAIYSIDSGGVKGSGVALVQGGSRITFTNNQNFDSDADTGDLNKTFTAINGTASGNKYLSYAFPTASTVIVSGAVTGLVSGDAAFVWPNSQTVIRKFIANLNTDNIQLYPGYGSFIWDTTNPIVKSDGTPFPGFEYIQEYKPVFQMIEEVSSDSYTKDGTYLFYLDMINRKFVWKARPNTPNSTVLTEGINIIDIKATQGTWNVVNACIIHAGNDKNAAAIRSLAYNTSSIGKMGFKWKYVAYTEIAREYIRQNPNMSNDTVRTNVRDIAKKWGKKYLEFMGGPKWKATITVRGSNGYSKGGLYSIEVPTLGWIDSNIKQLRLINIKQDFNAREGWTTTLELAEDEKTSLANFQSSNRAI